MTNIGKLTIKAEWWDASLTLRGFSQTNKHKLSPNVAIGLLFHPHLHQSILTILSCSVKLISFSQLFFRYKMFLRNSLMRFHNEWFQRVYLISNLFFDIWRVADGIRKRFWANFFPITAYYLCQFVFKELKINLFCTYSC